MAACSLDRLFTEAITKLLEDIQTPDHQWLILRLAQTRIAKDRTSDPLVEG